jgi:hypothetical protein
MEEAKNQPLTGFVRGGFGSGEFHTNVVLGLMNDRRLPQARGSTKPSPDEITWLLSHLELGSETVATLDFIESWDEFFRTLFADPQFRPLVPALRDSDLFQDLPLRLARRRKDRFADRQAPEPEPVVERRRSHPKSPREIVIVTGMHRSGTSLCANLINLLGVDMSDDLEATEDNPAGHWERPDLVGLHNRALRAIGREWLDHRHALAFPRDWLSQPQVQAVKNDIEDWIDVRLGQAGRKFGFKDPRAARLIPLWDQICTEMQLTPLYVFCVRHPAHVAESLVRRDGITSSEAIYRWMVYNADAVLGVAGRSVCILPFDQWFGDKAPLVHRLASHLGVEEAPHDPALAALVTQTIDPSLRHDSPAPEAESVVSALYQHIAEGASESLFSAAARKASQAFREIDELVQPMLEAAYQEPGPVRKATVEGAAPEEVRHKPDAVRLAGRLAASIKLHSEALTSLLERLDLPGQSGAVTGTRGGRPAEGSG